MMMLLLFQCEGWISDAALFLQGISKEAPHCTTTDDVDRLIKKIENYRLEGFQVQDARLNGMDRIVTDLYGISIRPIGLRLFHSLEAGYINRPLLEACPL